LGNGKLVKGQQHDDDDVVKEGSSSVLVTLE
jgi:hypothetical protein